jgi:dihydropteroate synthase-like protein
LKILLVTGTLAEDYVKKAAKHTDIECDVNVLPYPVASLLTLKIIQKYLDRERIKKYDFIMIPGLVKGDASQIERKIGLPVFKGPKDAWDIPYIIKLYREGKIRLSSSKPACELVDKTIQEEVKIAIEVKGNEKFRVGGLPIFRGGPIWVAAEIIDAPKLSKSKLMAMAKYYVDSGADIIDIGMVAGENNSNKVPEIINILRKVVDKPLSIDSLNPDEIERAIDTGIELIISIDHSNIDIFGKELRDIPIVLIPVDHEEGYCPEKAIDRVKYLESLLHKANKYGCNKVLCDLILNPINMPSLTESIYAFKYFSERNPDIPLFMGIGNVTELIDADSPGINALMTGLAMETGISIILTTEASHKTRGSVKEVVYASKMMQLAKKRGSVPKDLGIDLLMIKEKKRRALSYDYSKSIVVKAEKEKVIQHDKKGFFRIMVDYDKGDIIALHYQPRKREKPSYAIIGKKAIDIYLKIIELGLISELSHAAYLGRELTKAEIALKLGRTYIQDEELF